MKCQKNKKRCKNAPKKLKCKRWDNYKRTQPYILTGIKFTLIIKLTGIIFPPSNSKYYPTTGSKTMYELQRTIKIYTRSFMFFLQTSSERSQQSFFPLLCFDLHWKNLFVPNLTKNTLICYNIILKAVLQPVVTQRIPMLCKYA